MTDMFSGISEFMRNVNVLTTPFGNYLGVTLIVIFGAIGLAFAINKEQKGFYLTMLMGVFVLTLLVDMKYFYYITYILVVLVLLKYKDDIETIGQNMINTGTDIFDRIRNR